MTIPEPTTIVFEEWLLTVLAILLLYLLDCAVSGVRAIMIRRGSKLSGFLQFRVLTIPTILVILTCSMVLLTLKYHDARKTPNARTERPETI